MKEFDVKAVNLAFHAQGNIKLDSLPTGQAAQYLIMIMSHTK